MPPRATPAASQSGRDVVPPRASSNGGRSHDRIDSLGQMPLECTDELAQWVIQARALARELALQIEMGAGLIQHNVSRYRPTGYSSENRELRRAIRQTLKPLRKAASDSHSVADMIYRFWTRYRRDFEPLVHPQRNGSSWNFEEGAGRGRRR